MLVNRHMLAALIAVTIPWIIEWLLRRRRRVIDLPTIRFLLRTTEQRKVRLQDIILLFVRSAAIVLLVLALTRPIIRPDRLVAPGQKKPHALLVFDATYSNGQKVGSESAFSLARKIGSEVAAALPRGTLATLAVLGDHVAVEVECSDDLPAVRKRIERLEVSDRAGFIIDAVEWAEKFLAEKEIAPAEVYILSDMQQSTWGRRPDDPRDAQARFRRFCERNRVYVADTGGSRAANAYLTRFEPTEQVVAAGIPTTFAATVEAVNLELGEENRAQLTLYADGRKQSTQSFVMGSEPHTATFRHTFLRGGEYLLKVVLTGDGHSMDNTRYYIATVPENHRVLIVDEQGGKPLFEGGSGLLELAVSPPHKPGRDKVSAFLATVCTPAQFSQHRLADHEVVALTNLTSIPRQMVGALEAFVVEGGSLIAALGDRVVPFEHNRKLYKDGQGLLPCAIAEALETAEVKNVALVFEPSPDGPLAGLAREPAAAGGTRKYLQLALGAGDQGARVLARFSDGAPALVEKAFGRGRVVLFAGSVAPSWGDLPLSERFPVVVQELLRYVAGDANRDVNLEVGETFDQPVLMTSRHLTLERPDGRKARLTPVERGGEPLRHVTYSNTDRAGIYRVDAIPEVLAKRRFVVNLVPSEPDLRRLDEAKFALAFGRPEVSFLPGAARARRYVQERHAVKELAGSLLIALFLLLAVETYLAFRFGRRRM